MRKKIILQSLRTRAGLYIPMIIAVTVTLCLIGSAVIVGDSFHTIVDKQMAKYGANVILQSPFQEDITNGVPVKVRQSRLNGEAVRVGITSTQELLKQNPAWLVRGNGKYLVGQDVASGMTVNQGDRIAIDGRNGTAAILKSGTEFDEYIFIDGVAESPNLALIRSDTPEQYRGTGAVILSEMVKSKYTVLQSIGRLMFIMAIISGIAAIATVVNLARVDAGRRQQEFGIFKSLGASGGHIAQLISFEYLVLSGIAILIGITGSLGLSWGILHYVSNSSIEWNMGSAINIAVVTLIAFGGAGVTYIIESKRHQVAEELRGV